jgi:hypothetical protein
MTLKTIWKTLPEGSDAVSFSPRLWKLHWHLWLIMTDISCAFAKG